MNIKERSANFIERGTVVDNYLQTCIIFLC